MKKLMTLMLGMSLALGTVALSFAKADDHKAEKAEKKGKKGKKEEKH